MWPRQGALRPSCGVFAPAAPLTHFSRCSAVISVPTSPPSKHASRGSPVALGGSTIIRALKRCRTGSWLGCGLSRRSMPRTMLRETYSSYSNNSRHRPRAVYDRPTSISPVLIGLISGFFSIILVRSAYTEHGITLASPCLPPSQSFIGVYSCCIREERYHVINSSYSITTSSSQTTFLITVDIRRLWP